MENYNFKFFQTNEQGGVTISVLESGTITARVSLERDEIMGLMKTVNHEILFPEEFMAQLRRTIEKGRYEKRILEDADLLKDLVATYNQTRDDHRNHSSVDPANIWDDLDCFRYAMSVHGRRVASYRNAKGGV